MLDAKNLDKEIAKLDSINLVEYLKDHDFSMEYLDKIIAYSNKENKILISFFNIEEILKGFKDNEKLLALDKIITYDKKQEAGIINNFNLSQIIKIFSDAKKEIVLDRLIDFIDSDYCLREVLNAFPDNLKINILKKFINLNSQSNNKFFYVPEQYFNNISNDLKYQYLNLFLKNKLIDSLKIGYVFEQFNEEEKEKLLQFLFDNEGEYNLIDDYSISKIIMGFDSEKRLEMFIKYVLNNEKFSYLKVISYFTDSTLQYKVLDYITNLHSKETDENKELFYQELTRYFNFCIENNRIFPSGEILYPNLISFYSSKHQVNINNLRKFIEKFGYLVLPHLSNDNIKYAINLDREKFDLFLSIFDKNNISLNNDTLNTVCNSLLQREFIYNNQDDYAVFSLIDSLIKENSTKSLDKAKNIILLMADVVNIKKILSKYNLDTTTFLTKLFNGNDKMLDVLHDLTNMYIMKKRELYVKERLSNIYDELDLNKRYEKNFIKKKYIATTSKFNIECDIKYYSRHYAPLTPIQEELIKTPKILDTIIQYKKNPSNYSLDFQYKKYLKAFDELLNCLYENDILNDPTNDPNAKYIYYPKEVDMSYFLEIISELNMEKVDEFLLSDKEMLKELISVLNKYKILGWKNTFSSLQEKADFTFNEYTIVGIIEYFYKIYPELKKDNSISLTKLISYGNCCSSSSSKYYLLFGEENYRLLFENSGRNKASTPRVKRMKMATSHVTDMYEKVSVSVPPIDKFISLSNGKTINAVVGNATNMNNLTMGERTESCLRTGGAFYDLFKFCLKDKNGFHICYNDPDSKKFISRVSGIRNGNTIFLNELRNSVIDSYSDEDCVEATKLVADILIKESQDSSYPIDNVVITSDFAMMPYKDKEQDLNLSNRKVALFGLNHNLSPDGKAIVIASSNDDGSLVDIKLGGDNVSEYRTQRDKVVEYNNKDSAQKRIIQLHIIDELLKGVPLSDIDIKQDYDVLMCYSGEDFYVAIDSNGNIEEFVLECSKNKDRAYEEMESIISHLTKKNNELKGVTR